MTAYTNPTLIYLGNFATTDHHEGDYKSELAGNLVGVTKDHSEMKLVTVSSVDRDHDGVMEDDECNPHNDYISYNTGAGTVNQQTDSSMELQVKLTLADGSEKMVNVVAMQMQNGDLFISDLLNKGTLDNLEISNVEITKVNGDTFNGWYTNQSVDNTTLVAPEPELDGIVEGTEGNDVIDVNYTGDPHGDKIDNGDAILPGEAPQDDIVVAKGGDDLVKAGAGNDDVFAGAGDDTVYGNGGNDLIYGDSDNADGTKTVRESFEWDKAPDPNGSGAIDNTDTLGNFSQNTGNVDVDFTVVSQTSNSEIEFSTDQQNITGIQGDGEVIDANSSLDNVLRDSHEQAIYRLDFSQGVENVSFNINDIDGDGVVKVFAYVNGERVEVDIDAGSKLTLKDNDNHAGYETIDSDGGYLEDTSDEYSATITIAGPVDKIEIRHSQNGGADSGINITDVYFDAQTDAGTSTGAGDDELFGGAGDDTIIGEAGDDSLYGGKGDDVLGQAPGAGTGDELLTNGSFEDGTHSANTVNGLTGWNTVSGSPDSADDGTNAESWNPALDASDGTGYITMWSRNTGPQEQISQTLAEPLDEGTDYTFTFNAYSTDYINGQWFTPSDIPVTFEVLDQDGNVLGTTTVQGTDYEEYAINFTAPAGVTGIQLRPNGTTDNSGTYPAVTLDEVSLTVADPSGSGTGLGDDVMDGGEGDDLIYGGEDNDTIIGGEGVDKLYGNDDRDTFNGANAGDFVDGGEGGDDYDTLDLSTSGPLRVEYDANNPENGTVTFLDGDGNPTGTMDFVNIENVILPPNSGPDAKDDTATVEEDGSVVIPVLDNDTDPDGDPLTVISATADHGSVTINPDGTITYTPDPDYNGPDQITYTVDDGNGGTDSATVSVDVTPVNDGPDAKDDVASTSEDTPVDIAVLGNDTDPDGDPLKVTSATADHGDVTINPDGTVTYTPDADFNGTDTITYTIDDGNGGTDSAEVTVDVKPVNDGPDAKDDTATVEEDGSVVIPVLDNDTDPDGDPLTVISATADHGSVTINPDGTITYTPDPNYNGPDSISYKVSDGNGGEDAATVDVTVTPVNDDPVANDDAATTPFDTAVIIPVLGNDTDVDGDALTVTSATSPNGDVTINPDGTITFEPTPGFEGAATITYTVSDGNGGTDTAEVTVNVEEQPLDGIVQGTENNDLIDVNYTGDPHGDMIDNGDAILPGEQPQDDIVLGFEGDDTILSGLGDDDVYAGAGDDSVEGGTGDDLIYGDSDGPYGLNTVRESFEWDKAPDPDDGGQIDDNDELGDFTQNTGNVDVSFTLVNQSPNSETEFSTDAQNVNDMVGDGNPIDDNSSLDNVLNGSGNQATYTLDFSADVDDVSFNINDIDGDGVVKVYAYIDGQRVEVEIEAGDKLTLQDNDSHAGDETIDSNGGYAGDTSESYSATITIPGPVDKIEIVHTQDGNANSGINITDVYFDAPVTGVPGNDTLNGGDGEDTIHGEEGDDVIDGGADNDTITGGDGSDTVQGGGGDDVIDTSGSNPASDYGFAPIVPQDTDMEDDRDSVDGGAGNDTITTGDDRDTISGGDGDDSIDGGLDDDIIDGGDDNDSIIGGHGADDIDGGDGNDTIWGGLGSGTDNLNIVDALDPRPDNGLDTIHGGDGNDVIYGQDDDDVLYGDDGNDTIDGGIDEDTIFGGEGDDSLLGGQGADSIDGGEGNDRMFGGDDRDTFVNVNAGDHVDGNEGGDDYDTLDLTGSAPTNGSLNVTYDPNNDENGVVEFFDENGNTTGTMEFFNIENVIPCFTPGTLIATPKGERRVEELQVGDRVITRDNGIQEIRWAGAKPISWQEMNGAAHLKPILIAAGSLGNGLPERDMLVSPNHRVLVANDRTALYFDEREVLVAAKHLVDNKGIFQVETRGTTYIHFMFQNHEVVLSDGAWTESFQPGDYSLKGIGNAQRNEIFELFPELETQEGLEDFSAARRTLKKHEAALLK